MLVGRRVRERSGCGALILNGLILWRGRKGPAARYSLAAVRAAERDLAAQGEAAYRTMVAAWQPSRPERKKVTGAAASKGTRLIKPTG
jgi:hypothetical protein